MNLTKTLKVVFEEDNIRRKVQDNNRAFHTCSIEDSVAAEVDIEAKNVEVL